MPTNPSTQMIEVPDENGEIIQLAVFLRTEYNYNRDRISDQTGLFCPPEEGQTQQQFAEEVDINTIVMRFGLTGQLPENPQPPVSGDFTGITDFQSAMNAVRRAEEGFMEMPANIRARFHNNPQEMLEFLEDRENYDEALKLGIVAKPPEKTRDVIAAIDEMRDTLKPAIQPEQGK